MSYRQKFAVALLAGVGVVCLASGIERAAAFRAGLVVFTADLAASMVGGSVGSGAGDLADSTPAASPPGARASAMAAVAVFVPAVAGQRVWQLSSSAAL